MASLTGRGEHLTISYDYNTTAMHIDVGLDHLVEVLDLLSQRANIDLENVEHKLKRAILQLVQSNDDELAAEARLVLLHLQRLEESRKAKKAAEESDD